MRRLSQKRLLRLASLILTGLTVVFGILWVVAGLRPAIACGVLDYLGSGNWSAALACFNRADYEALLFVVALAGSFVAWIASRKAPDTPLGEYHPTPVEQARNRKGMIDRVWSIWIEGHLDQTLYQAVLMSLGMTLRPVAPRPGSVRLRRAGEAERPVPEHVPTVQLFEEGGHSLLILGEPGSGKTTMMLDLARSLLQRAKEDESTPIPVVFNLSSLTEPEQSLDDWLVGEFRSSYDVPEKVARYWLAHNELALLLDGLDEVRADRRAGVVEKIDQYRAQYMDPWLVICCRQNEYAELVADDAALEGVDAVVLQPLADQQIKGYLTDLAGDEPQRLWRALQEDDVLLELADTPLMLNVMLLAAEQLDWSALPSGQGAEVVRSHIYDAYIRSMLARPRNTVRRYPDDKTLHWLHWLAGKMVAHDQTVFLLERMKRSWFNQPWQSFVRVPILMLLIALFLALIFGLLFGLTAGAIGGLFFGLCYGLPFGVIDFDVKRHVTLKLERSVILVVVVLAPFVTLRRWMLGISVAGLSILLVFGLTLGLGDGIIGGLLMGLSFGWLFALIDESTELGESHLRGRPYAAIRQSVRNGLKVGLFIGLPIGILGVLLFEPFGGFLFGLLGGLAGALSFGWAYAVQHYTLRLVLFLDGSMPLNYVRFLDFCVDRVLLRRVVGGYMFIHRTMMEHIAGLGLEQWKDEPA